MATMLPGPSSRDVGEPATFSWSNEDCTAESLGMEWQK